MPPNLEDLMQAESLKVIDRNFLEAAKGAPSLDRVDAKHDHDGSVRANSKTNSSLK